MLLIGHRGISGIAPDNTLAGFEQAIELGLPIVEMDLRMWDDEIWVDHNPIVEQPSEHVPTMREVLEKLCGRVKIYLDIKESTVIEPLCKLLEEYFDAGRWTPTDVYIASYNHFDVLRASKLLGGVHLGTLMSSTPIGTAQIVQQANATFVVLDISNLTEQMVTDCHQAGIIVFVYTIKCVEHFKRCQQFVGISGLVIDYPLDKLPSRTAKN